MAKAKATKPLELDMVRSLWGFVNANLSSHGIFVEDVLNDLKDRGWAEVEAKHKMDRAFRFRGAGPTLTVGLASSDDFHRDLKREGRGGFLGKGKWRGIGGLDLLYKIAGFLDLKHGAAMFFGRGRQYDAVREALRKAAYPDGDAPTE